MKLNQGLTMALTYLLLPFIYLQGKRIRREVPTLPEAKGISGQTDQESPTNFTLLCIGESTIAGVGASTHEDGFCGTLAKSLSKLIDKNISWKVYARSGYTAKRVAHKIIPKITESQADLIVIGLGGNDAFTINRPKQWKKDLQIIIEKLHSKYPNAPIVFINMPPIKEFPAFTKTIKWTIGNWIEHLGKAVNEVSKDKALVYCNPEVITLDKWMKKLNIQGDPSQFFSDGVHPSLLTYQIWAKESARFIEQSVYSNKESSNKNANS